MLAICFLEHRSYCDGQDNDPPKTFLISRTYECLALQGKRHSADLIKDFSDKVMILNA